MLLNEVSSELYFMTNFGMGASSEAKPDLFVTAGASKGGVATAILGITDVARRALAMHPQRIKPLLHQLVLPVVDLICMGTLWRSRLPS